MQPDDDKDEKALERVESQALEYIPRLNQDFFTPFDRLLERKAEYALKLEAEKGEIPPWLLSEIEALAKFRDYTERLEAFRDESIMSEFILLRRQIDEYREKWQTVCRCLEDTHWLLQQVWKQYGPGKWDKYKRSRNYSMRRRPGAQPKRRKKP